MIRRALSVLLSSTAAVAACVAAGAAPLRTGDLLAVLGDAIVRVVPESGAVTPFSPRPGSGPNQLSSPRGVATDEDGEVFVVASGKLFSIDPTNGVQREVRAFNPMFPNDYALDLGPSPWGVGVSPVPAGPFGGRTILVASHGSVYEVIRDGFAGTYSDVFASFPAGWENYVGETVSAEDPGGGALEAWVGIFRGVLEGGSSGLSAIYTEPDLITGSRRVGGRTFLARTFGTYCTDDPSHNGLYELVYQQMISAYQAQALLTGGDLSCPGPIAAADPALLYVVDRSATPNRIVRVAGSPNPQTSIAATMPTSATLGALAVYVPEPGEGEAPAGSLAALAALVGLRRRRAGTES